MKVTRDVDRRLALAFGGVTVAVLLLAGSFAVAWFDFALEREEDRLSRVVTQTLGVAVNRVSFSGRHHATLLLEEIHAGQPREVHFLRLVDVEGRVVAQSAAASAPLDDAALAAVREAVAGRGPITRTFERDGISTREVTLAWRGGYDDAVKGALQVGLSREPHRAAAAQMIGLSLLVLVLLVAAATVTTRVLSVSFGAPVRALADELAATLVAVPDPLFEVNERGLIVSSTVVDFPVGALASQVLGEGVGEVFSRAATEGRALSNPLGCGGRWLELSVARKSPGSNLLVVARDVTARVRAEEAEAEARGLFQTVSEFATDWVYWRSEDRERFNYISPSCEVVTGYPAEAFRARPELLDEIIHPDDRALWADHLASGQRFAHGQLEFRIVTRTGEIRWISHACRQVLRADGSEAGRRSSNHDISDLKRVQAELSSLRERAEAASHSKTRFLATMSHELRTPMNGILGMAQLLLDDTLSEATRREYVQTLVTSGQTLLGLLNDILDLSKVEAGKLELSVGPCDLGRLVGDVDALFRGSAHLKGLELQARWSGPGDGWYLADAMRLTQMLSNLVGNAIKFTSQGVVQLDVRAVEGGVEFSVCDEGIGISTEQRDQLFQPFSQGDTSVTRQFGGTGLGLSIVKRLAVLMGGEVGASQRDGRGSRFWFSVPLAPCTAEATACSPSSRSLAPRLAGHVLLVEDNVVNQKVAAAFLAKLGLDVTVAGDGVRCLEVLDGGLAPSLVLMDVQMPRLDGFETTARIRAGEAAGRVPIVGLSADAFADDRRRALEVGMDDFLAKPLVLAELREVLGRWLAPRARGARLGV